MLSSQQWSVPRSGEALVEMPALRAAVQAFQEHPGAVLVIRHPGGDEGVLWAHELQSWLVALGIGSAQIELIPGSPDPQSLALEVKPRRSARALSP